VVFCHYDRPASFLRADIDAAADGIIRELIGADQPPTCPQAGDGAFQFRLVYNGVLTAGVELFREQASQQPGI